MQQAVRGRNQPYNTDPVNDNTTGYPITIRHSTVDVAHHNVVCYNQPCKDTICLKNIEYTIKHIVFLVPSCARYIHRLIAWLKHISYTLEYLNFKGDDRNNTRYGTYILHHSQIFTIISANDDIQFIREQLKKHGFHNVEILIANHIANDIGGAQLKPLHAFDILYNKMRNDNLILQQMRWLIHVDDDTTVNLAALAFQLQQYNDQNHDPILLSHLMIRNTNGTSDVDGVFKYI